MGLAADVSAEITAEFPGFKIVLKTDSAMMRAIDVFLRVITLGKMASFMDSYITTIGLTVYVPSDWDAFKDEQIARILRHERVHMRQARRYSRPLFSFLYLFFPLPGFLAYFRAKFEMEAYEETMRATAEQVGQWILDDPKFRAGIVGHFTGPEYFWMWPFKSRVERWYDEASKRILGK
jgi:hypothetical protein